MHHRMAPSRIGCPSLNVVIIPPVIVLVLYGTIQWPPLRLLIKFTSYSWNIAGWISTKSIAEQLGITRERVGSIDHEDLDIRNLSAKSVPKCLNENRKPKLWHSSEQLLDFFFFRFARSKLFPVTICDQERNLIMWLWHGDKQQWMEWRHSGSPGSKIFPVKKTRRKSYTSNLDINTSFSALMIFQRAKLSTWSFTYPYSCNLRKLWGKNSAGIWPSYSYSCIKTPRLTRHFQPSRNLPTHPILRILPRLTTTCSLDWTKNN
jgi:hypothetical protein